MKIIDLINKIKRDASCQASVSTGIPYIPSPLSLPDDLKEFYENVGATVLFKDADYSIEIVSPNDFVRANSIIVGEECSDDISHNWFIVAKSSDQCITIDLDDNRKGRCYDSFWDRHGVVGECRIIALSFTELLTSLYHEKGDYWYWLKNSFNYLGDAYD